ncbi:MAG: hypothetical protein M0Z53_05450 [Thermaerobacter sp.]|nr:hypothetical protein [Thermaerobacter sp.]
MTVVLLWLAALLTFGFAVNLGSRYRARGFAFYLWWSLSFILYTVAFAVEALSVAHDYNLAEYQLYIVSSSGLVGFMSVGTGYLAFSQRMAKIYAIFIMALVVALVLTTYLVPPAVDASWARLSAGAGITGPTRLIYIVMSSLGGTVVLVGALWSWWKTRRFYNLLIAAGVMVSSSAGALASQGRITAVFPFVNIAAVTLIFLGYIYSRPSAAGRYAKSKVEQTT